MVIRCGIMTSSDRSAWGERADLSSPAISQLLQAQSWQITYQKIVPDGCQAIAEKLISWCDSGEVDITINLPGSPKGTVENLQIILPVLPHAVQKLTNDLGAEAVH